MCISLLLIKQTDMENSLDHLFGNLMGGLDEIVKDAENIVAKHHPDIFEEKYQCQVCGKENTITNTIHIITKGFFCPPCVPRNK